MQVIVRQRRSRVEHENLVAVLERLRHLAFEKIDPPTHLVQHDLGRRLVGRDERMHRHAVATIAGKILVDDRVVTKLGVFGFADARQPAFQRLQQRVVGNSRPPEQPERLGAEVSLHKAQLAVLADALKAHHQVAQDGRPVVGAASGVVLRRKVHGVATGQSGAHRRFREAGANGRIVRPARIDRVPAANGFRPIARSDRNLRVVDGDVGVVWKGRHSFGEHPIGFLEAPQHFQRRPNAGVSDRLVSEARKDVPPSTQRLVAIPAFVGVDGIVGEDKARVGEPAQGRGQRGVGLVEARHPAQRRRQADEAVRLVRRHRSRARPQGERRVQFAGVEEQPSPFKNERQIVRKQLESAPQRSFRHVPSPQFAKSADPVCVINAPLSANLLGPRSKQRKKPQEGL